MKQPPGEPTMQEHRIIRNNKPALSLTGDIIAEARGNAGDPEALRWHELRVYRTGSGRYILEISYKTTWRGENDHTQAEPVALDDIPGALGEYDPDAHVRGFPDHPKYADRQRALLDYLQVQYHQTVTELLAQLPQVDEVVE